MIENKAITSTAMDNLRRKYAERLREREAIIHKLVESGGAKPLSPEDRMALQTQAHNLAGSGATYGYPDISKAGRALEESIESGSVETIFLPLANKLIDVCRSVSWTQSLPQKFEGITVMARKSEVSKTKKKLLVIDDDHSVHELINEMFRKEVDLFTALDENTGMEIIHTQKPNLVLLDGTLGASVLEKLGNEGKLKEINIVMLTSNNKAAHIDKAVAAGVLGYIIKPFDLAVVSSRIRTYLARNENGTKTSQLQKDSH